MVFLVQIQCCCHHLHSNKINVSIALLYYSQSSSKQCMIIIIQTLYQHENTTFCTQNFILLIFIILFYTCIILLYNFIYFHYTNTRSQPHLLNLRATRGGRGEGSNCLLNLPLSGGPPFTVAGRLSRAVSW